MTTPFKKFIEICYYYIRLLSTVASDRHNVVSTTIQQYDRSRTWARQRMPRYKMPYWWRKRCYTLVVPLIA